MDASANSKDYKCTEFFFGCEEGTVVPRIYGDGSFIFAKGDDRIAVSFNAGDIADGYSWYLSNGYLPCHEISYSSKDYSVKFVVFADFVQSVNSESVVAYTRFTAKNITSSNLPFPAAIGPVEVLTDIPESLAPGEEASVDVAVVIENKSSSVPDSLGTFDEHFSNMKEYWSERLSKIVDIKAPHANIGDTAKATYIFSLIMKIGYDLCPFENYGLTNTTDFAKVIQYFFALGDLTHAREYILTYCEKHQNFTRHDYKIPWIFSVYQFKSGDDAFIRDNLDLIRKYITYIKDSIDPETGLIKPNPAEKELRTADTLCALLSLEAFASATGKIGEGLESIASRKLARSIRATLCEHIAKAQRESGLPYLPCDPLHVQEDDSDFTKLHTPFTFGALPWEGHLFTFSSYNDFDESIMATLESSLKKDVTVDLPAPEAMIRCVLGLSTDNYQYRSLALRKISEIKEKSSISPIISHGSIPAWCNLSKIFVDSFVAMRNSEMIFLGRGIPCEWLENGDRITVKNYSGALGSKISFEIYMEGNSIFVDVPEGEITAPIIITLPSLIKYDFSAEGCECSREYFRVITLSPLRHVEIKLDR